ncbi:amino acid adenylation domain-containing protein [Plantactinospora sp. WMMB334]|uniref:amino acid adenylation domain-containing protein n=1 Tax=Plantactinospora sp. WMMB334 TaxID=3404119 RepID=UPI003B95FAFC
MERPALYRRERLDPPQGHPRHLAEALSRAARLFPEAGVVAVRERGDAEFVGYPALLDRARRLLTAVRRRGLRAGDPVVLYVGDPVHFLASFWACALGGLRPLLIARPADPGATAAALDRLRHVTRLLGEPLVVGDRPDPAGLSGRLRLLDVTRHPEHPPATELHQAAPDDVALLMTSSGSTGKPKIIQLTQRGLLEFSVGTPALLPIRPGQTTLNWLPLDHSGAFLLYHLLEVFVGCTNVHVSTELVLADPLHWLDLIAEHAVNHAWAPNFGYQLVNQALAERPGRHWDLSSVATLVSGGEQITVPVMTDFLRATAPFGVRPEAFVPAWGMTETVTGITFARPGLTPNVHRIRTSSLDAELEWADDADGEEGGVTFVAVGSPAPGATLRVVDDTGGVLPERRIGRLQVSSARVTPGYLDDPDADRAAFVTGGPPGAVWLDTGDLAFGVDGQVVMVGRQDDRIILNGQNHYTHDIENAVAEVPGVDPAFVAACGVPDGASGTESLVLFLGTDAAEPAGTVGAVRQALFARLGGAVRVVTMPTAAFPKTGGGKKQRSALRRRFLDGGFGSGPAPATPAPARAPAADPAPAAVVGVGLADSVRSVFRVVLRADVGEGTPFYELGIDSVTLVRLHARLQQQLGLRFSKLAMLEHPTIAALTSHLGTLGTAPAGRSRADSVSGAEQRIAIVGMSARLPGADTLEQFWANLTAGVVSVRRFGPAELAAAGIPAADRTRADFVPVTGALAGIDAFDAGFFRMSAAEAERTDPAHRLFLECCYHALEHGGYAGTTGTRRIGVFAGSGMNLYTHQSYLLNNLLGRPHDPIGTMQAAIGTQPDFLASLVAYRLGLTGPAVGVQTACSTSLVAVHLACQALRTGDADLVLAGAAAVHVPQVTGYRAYPGSILSPSGRCRAFDADADGTVGGNGVAAVLLKRLDRALEDGDTIHAVILGSAVNNDGASKVGFTAPSVPGQVDVIERALDRAGVPAETISYLEAHGTGTPLGDPVELRAAARALRDRTDEVGFCTVGSVKPNIGHLDSCAGMAGLIKTVLMLSHRTLVPLANWRRPNPELELDGSPFVLGTELRQWHTGGTPRRAGVTALGVGGTNAHVILEEAPRQPEPDADADVLGVLPLSAADPAALAELIGRTRDHLHADPGLAVGDLVTTAALGRPHHPHRVAVVGASATELADALDRARPGETPAVGTAPLTFAFTGQGAGRPRTAGELHARFPAFRRALDECERAYAEAHDHSLLALLCGEHGEHAWSTETAQPALFAFQVALARLWRAFGVEPGAVLGHSVGVLPALCVAGALSAADGVRLTALRGELMGRQAPPGAMVGLWADRTTADKVASGAGVEIAAVNGPEEYVLTGPEEAIGQAVDRLVREGISWQRLAVDRAFHSASLDPVVGIFAARAAATAISPLEIPMACTVSGRLLPAGTVLDAGYLARQIRRPVLFADAVQALTDGGSRRFLELGPDAVLSGIGQRARPDTDWVPAQRRDTDPIRATEHAVAELYRLGVPVEWTAVAGGGRRRPLPSYPFRRDRYWIDATTAPDRNGGAGVAAGVPDRGDGTPDRPSAAPTAAQPAPTTVDRAPAAVRDTPIASEAEILATVREQTARQLGATVATVRPDTTFLQLGADSLAMLRMVQEVRNSFGIALAARELFTAADTPERLAALIVDRLGADAGPATAQPGPAVPESRRPGPESRHPGPATRTTDGTTDQGRPAPTGRCDFSLYFFGDYPDQDRRDKYGPILDAARFADRHGFHAVWLPERHFHSFGGLFPNPVVLAAAVARETSRIRINAGSVVLPLHHPIRVAEEWSVVDNLSDGRVGLCVASGWHANDFALNPEAFGRHRDLMYEQLETVQALWSGASVPARSGSGAQIDVRIYPRPVQPMPPLFVAAVGNPQTYRAAAARDLGVVTNLMMQSIEQLAENIALYRRTRREHGLDPEAGRVVVLVHTYLGDDVRRARAEAYQPFCDYLRSSLSLLGGVANSLGMRIDEHTPAEDVDFMLGQAYARYCEGRALIGTIDSSAPIVGRLSAAGVDEIACFVDFGVPADQMLRSLHLVAEARLRHQRPDPASPRPDPVRDGPVPQPSAPLSAAQRGIWFLERLYPGRSSYHEPKAVKLHGALDVTALRWALRAVVERHASLRTVFRTVDGEPQQVVLASAELDCPLVDLPGATADQAIRQAVRSCGTDGLDLATGPLLRLRLVRLGTDEHVLVLYAHHIVFDSFSTAVFVRDLAALYRSWPDPRALPPLPLSYPEHVRARLLGADERRRHLDYWRTTLAGAPLLRLPTDRPRPPVMTASGAALVHDLDAGLTAAVREFSRAHRATPFMTLLAAVAAVLGRFGGQHDLVLGTVLTNRPAGTEELIGLFIDSVPLRIDLSGAPTLGGLVQRIRDGSTEAFEHAGVGFDEIIEAVNPERDTSRNPLFQVMVEYENASTVDFDPPRVGATMLDVPGDRAPLDLTLYLTAHPDRVQCVVEYNTDLFDESSVRRLLDYLEAVLARACAAPELDLPALTAPVEADRAVLHRWGGDQREEPGSSLPALVEQQVARTPDAVALVAGDVRLSYAALDRRANALAWRLHDHGVRPDEYVAVCLPRGVPLIVALLGVQKAGAAYLPLDPSLPEGRLGFMASDSGAVLVLAEEAGEAGPGARLGERLGLPVLRVAPDDCTDPRAEAPPPCPAGPENLAYAIYTSGSTGRPKGVAVPHRGPANLIRWYLRRRPALRTLQWTSVGFDVSVQEIFSTLASGAALVLLAEEARHDPEAVVGTIRRHRVERVFMPFTPLKYLLETAPSLPSLREIVSAGEELTLTPALRRFLAAHPGCALYNEYGPTEASIIATVGRVRPDESAKPPIGRPVDNVLVRLLDERRLPVPVGAVGEIYLGGVGLARGYIARPEETAWAFVTDPASPTGTLYRTGDLGRWLPDGSLQYLGRLDDQVKIRGHRVEVGEPQRALYALDGVRDAAVLARKDDRGETYLAAYVVLADGDADDAGGDVAARLADRLAATLPSYLVPSRWVRVDELPVNASGKLDRARLPEPGRADRPGAAPENELEHTLHRLWADQLGLTEVPVDASFFALGGHSLTGVELVDRIRQALGVEVRVADLFHAPTIRAMAGRLGTPAPAPASGTGTGGGTGGGTGSVGSGTPAPALVETAPATSFQQRGWRVHHTNPHPEVYNVAHRIRLDGDLDASALRRAIGGLVRRHAALRTRLVLRDGELIQQVLADLPVRLPVTDLTAEADGGSGWCRAAAEEPFTLADAPLWRARLGRLGDRRWVLVLVLHHVICDGWSMRVIWRELSSLYPAEVAGAGAELPVPAQFPEYARWRAAQLCGDRRDALVAFWRSELAGAPLRVDLPYDRPRPDVLSGRGALHRFAVPEPTVGLVHAAARELASTPAAVLTAAFAGWLAELSGERDLVLPLSSANRVRPGHGGLVGPVGEALLVRVTLADGLRFDDLVHAVTRRTFTALDHHALALGEVAAAVGVDLATPQLLFTVVTAPPPTLPLPELSTEVRSLAVPNVARTELYVVLTPGEETIEGVFEYSTDLFDTSTVRDWAAAFVAALHRMAAAPQAEIHRRPVPR